MLVFLKLGLNGKVIDGIEVEDKPENTDEYVAEITGYPFWKERKEQVVGIGYRYDEDLDVFIPPKPFSAWSLNTNTLLWEAPTPMPEDGRYMWDEEIQDWAVLEERPTE